MARRPKNTLRSPSVPALTKTAIAVHSTVLIGLAAGVFTVQPTQAYAQAAIQQEAPAQQYNIAAGSLGSALNSFARAAGIELSVDGQLIQNKVSQGLRGNYTVAQGFAQLLAGQGLQIVRGTSGIYSLRVAVNTGSETTLPDVVVTAGAAAGSATEGTGSYTAAGPSKTASGLGLTLRETPQSVTVMSRQRMDDFNLNTLTDVLEQTPGLTLDRQGDANNFTIRGSSVNLQTDGMRQVTSGWATDAHKLNSLNDLVEMDRVEVLKGSSGLMNGAGAYGGTINMIRKRPTREFQAYVKAGAGSWSNYRAEADIGGTLNAAGTLRGRAVVAAADGKNFRDYVKHNNQTFFATIDADLTPNTLLNVNVTHRRREYVAPSDTAMIQAYNANGSYVGLMPRSFNVGAPWSQYKEETTTLAGSLEHRFQNGWVATLRVSDSKNEMPYAESGYLWTAVPEAADVGWTSDYVSRNRTVSLNLNGSFDLFNRTHDVYMGIEASRNSTDSYSGADRLTGLGWDYAGGGAVIPVQDMSLYPMDNHSYFSAKRRSVFATGRFHIADPVKVITGVRITDYEQFDNTPYASSNRDMKKNGVVTPYAGLVVDVHKDVSVYASYASIFNVQNAQTVTGDTLPPEEGLTYELGAKGEFFEKRLNASIAHFWMKTDNVAELTGEKTPSNQSAYRAVSGVTRRGYELELSGELAPGWQAQGSYVVNSSTLTSSNNNPKQQFKLATSYKFNGALEGLTIGGGTRWQSKTAAGKLKQSSFWLVDLMARYQVSKQLSVAANVNNLFDKSYFAGMRDFGRVQYTWGAPRSVNVNVRYDF